MIFYDFEVFAYDWLVVLIDLNAKQETVIINDPDKLKASMRATREPFAGIIAAIMTNSF
jgi:DNA polymerase